MACCLSKTPYRFLDGCCDDDDIRSDHKVKLLALSGSFTTTSMIILPLGSMIAQHGGMDVVFDNAVSHTCSFSSSSLPQRRRRASPRRRRGLIPRSKDSTTINLPPSSTASASTSRHCQFPLKDSSCWESSPDAAHHKLGLTQLAFMGLRMPRPSLGTSSVQVNGRYDRRCVV
jgi:hypothetical protein